MEIECSHCGKLFIPMSIEIGNWYDYGCCTDCLEKKDTNKWIQEKNTPICGLCHNIITDEEIKHGYDEVCQKCEDSQNEDITNSLNEPYFIDW
jgi:uncharacterized CHY-type Zn-finger protein